jgi:hypothetical protein
MKVPQMPRTCRCIGRLCKTGAPDEAEARIGHELGHGVPWVYPALEVVHIVGIALLIGSLVVFELRVWGLRRAVELGALARLALPITLAGFALALAAAWSCSSARSTRCRQHRLRPEDGARRRRGERVAFTCAAAARRWIRAARRPRSVAGAMGRRRLLRPLDRLQVRPPARKDSHANAAALAFAAAGLAAVAAARPPWLERLRPGPAALSRRQGRQRRLEEPARRGDAARDAGLAVPADLAKRAVPAQSASVDAARILAAARVPTRKDPVWELELAPLTRMEAWKVAEIKPGQSIAASATPSRREGRGGAAGRVFVRGRQGLRAAIVPGLRVRAG